MNEKYHCIICEKKMTRKETLDKAIGKIGYGDYVCAGCMEKDEDSYDEL